MVNILVIIYLLFAHFIGDFILQTDRMAKNKSTNFYILLEHCICYITPFLPLLFIMKSYLSFVSFIIINVVLHFITDAISSRATSYLWQKGDRHNFFVVIGLDQTVHYITLLLTIKYFM